MTWIDRTSNETGFVIQRSTGSNSNYTDLATVGANVTYLEDLQISTGTTYYYRVAAIVNGNRTAYSNESNANTNIAPFVASALPYKGLSNVLADMDKDGDMDIVAGDNNGVKIYNNENGVFTLQQTVSSGWNYYCTVKVADLDNDNDLDIFWTLNDWIGNSVYEAFNNQSSFNFVTIDNGIIYAVFVPFDFSNNNTIDLLLGAWQGQTSNFQRYQYQGSNFTTYTMDIPVGNWGTSDIALGRHQYSEMIGIADMDNNGMQDIIAPYGNAIKIYPSFSNTFVGANSSSIFPYSSPAPTYFDVGGLDVGDIDKNGLQDVLVGGENHFGILLNHGAGVFSDTSNASFPKVVSAQVQLGDYDMDGDLDFFISNTATGDSYLYRNDNLNFVSVFSKSGGDAFYKWIDFDSDGDLDILGTLGTIYLNSLGTNKQYKNVPPAAPSNLRASYSGTTVTFSWDRATDLNTTSTGLTYNLYVKRNGVFVMSPMADLATGYRKILKRGNVDQNTSWTIDLPGSSTIEWGVQAIDNSYAGSNFTTATFVKPPLPQPIKWTDLVNVSASSNTITKTTSDFTWTAGAASQNVIPPYSEGWIEMEITNINWDIMFGLSSSNADASWNTIEYNCYISRRNGFVVEIYKSGVQLQANAGPYAVGDKIRIERVNGNMNFKRNNRVIYSIPANNAEILRADASLFDPNSKIYNAYCSHTSGAQLGKISTVENLTVGSYDMDSVTFNGKAKFKTVYPNPTSGKVTIRYPDNSIQDQVDVRIVNPTGDEMYQLRWDIKSTHNQLTIDLTDYPGGIYIIYVDDKVYKLIKV